MNMELKEYFNTPLCKRQRQYEAIRSFVCEGWSAEETAKKFGYTVKSLYSLKRDFKRKLDNGELDQYIFSTINLGRNRKQNAISLKNKIITLRKQYFSVEEIKEYLDAQGEQSSETYIYKVIKNSGFVRLPRRTKLIKKDLQSNLKIEAQKTEKLKGEVETFNTANAGVLCFLPLIKQYGIDKIIQNSDYPQTKTLSKLNSILGFIALKISSIKRYSKDDLWCMDRGLGLFAGLNVLPKAAWFSSYSHRVTRDMNIKFLRELQKIWSDNHLLSDTNNLDFTTIPYWGDDAHLENNWSGKRHQPLASILAAVSQDPDSGLITYGDADVQHKTEPNIVVEFLDFYRSNGYKNLKYLVFDSKFTTYKNLSKLDDEAIKFVTIRRRGCKIVSELEALPKESWQKISVMAGDGKKRSINVYDQKIKLREYDNKQIRQVAITGHGKIKPALIITNDFSLTTKDIVRKYAKRWIVEKSISEQTYFFHLNQISSSMVIKVDFDLTMTILSYNLYRLLAINLPRYTNQTAEKLFEKFVSNGGKVQIDKKEIILFLKKKRNLPAMLNVMKDFTPCHIDFLGKNIRIEAATYS